MTTEKQHFSSINQQAYFQANMHKSIIHYPKGYTTSTLHLAFATVY